MNRFEVQMPFSGAVDSSDQSRLSRYMTSRDPDSAMFQGGIRASNYNSVPMENIHKLAAYLAEFAQRKECKKL